ncbi:MAG: alcohol dehydrogenase [Mycobacterium sp.]|nr:alcohol dehydrogenase [Mycobacterium sp.]
MTNPTYRSTAVVQPNGDLELVDAELREPGLGQVRIAVQACGVCHSDSEFVTGHWPGLSFPVTPGHEIAGVIEAIGDGVVAWRPGDRVAIGWGGGYCGYCSRCRRGDFMYCEQGWVTGASFAGGFAEKVIAPQTALARIPEGLSSVEAAPLACAGVTMFNSLRHSGARAGDTVAILGLGGLGHLGVQFAAALGYRTVVVARGQDKAELAHQLGAHHYIDSKSGSVAEQLQQLGGARVVQATAANADAMSAAVDGLALHGELIALAVVTDSLHVTPLQLVMNSSTVHGHAAGSSQDIEDTMNFAQLHDIRPMVETMPLDDVAKGYARMMSNNARFRVVLTVD